MLRQQMPTDPTILLPGDATADVQSLSPEECFAANLCMYYKGWTSTSSRQEPQAWTFRTACSRRLAGLMRTIARKRMSPNACANILEKIIQDMNFTKENGAQTCSVADISADTRDLYVSPGIPKQDLEQDHWMQMLSTLTDIKKP